MNVCDTIASQDDARLKGHRVEELEAFVAGHVAQKLQELIMRNPRKNVATHLPLARIKRIMKQDSCDPHPRMISADAVPYMALATQVFIGLVTKLAWSFFTQKAKRNTLQLKDLKDAVGSMIQFDFLIDTLDEFDEKKQQEEMSAEIAQASCGINMRVHPHMSLHEHVHETPSTHDVRPKPVQHMGQYCQPHAHHLMESAHDGCSNPVHHMGQYCQPHEHHLMESAPDPLAFDYCSTKLTSIDSFNELIDEVNLITQRSNHVVYE